MTVEDIDNQAINNPLSKEELRKQFVEKTEEMDLKHTFTFDEAWEVAQELRNRQDFRDKMMDLEQDMINGGALVGQDVHNLNPTKHTFAGGCYIREIFNPAGILVITKIHKKEHPFFLMKGKMSIFTEEGIETIEAPYNGITKPGTKRAIYAHEDCVFITVHATDKKTPEEVEEEVIAKDFSDSDISLSKSIEEFSEIIGVNLDTIKMNKL
tara:strand:+ start:223 stop:855 length:633 start_codon:yes stop_codon:yes gene_type:complete